MQTGRMTNASFSSIVEMNSSNRLAMTPSRLPLTAIRSFEAAARYMKFSRAAEELSVSPSAVSHQIRGLEDELGVRLFNRDRRQLVLSAPGRRLAAAAGDTLARLCEALEEIRDEVPSRTADRLAPALLRAQVALAPLGPFLAAPPRMWNSSSTTRIAPRTSPRKILIWQ